MTQSKIFDFSIQYYTIILLKQKIYNFFIYFSFIHCSLNIKQNYNNYFKQSY
jgi:hypothetical protein